MKDKNGVLIHKTPEVFLNEPYISEENDFERLLYRTFEDCPDPKQLIKILRKKLQSIDKVNGAKYVEILDQML